MADAFRLELQRGRSEHHHVYSLANKISVPDFLLSIISTLSLHLTRHISTTPALYDVHGVFYLTSLWIPVG